MASAMRLRPSGLSLRLRGAAVAVAAFAAGLRPLGRPELLLHRLVRSPSQHGTSLLQLRYLRVNLSNDAAYFHVLPPVDIVQSHHSVRICDNSNVCNSIFDDTEATIDMQITCRLFSCFFVVILTQYCEMHGT